MNTTAATTTRSMTRGGALALALGVALLAFGSTRAVADGLDFSRAIPWSGNNKAREPDRMVAVWTHTILNRPGRPSVRGFGGRVMFYERRSDEPIKVEGELTVFTFDDTERDGTHCTPDRKYVFTEEQLPEHYSKSKIGHSYSIWIPWDEVGGPMRKISLVARFESKEDNVCTSQINTQILPGVAPVPPPGAMNAAVPPAGVQPAAHHAPANPPQNVPWNTPQMGGQPIEQAARARMTTTTIDIAPGFISPTPPSAVQDRGTTTQAPAYQATAPSGAPNEQRPWQPPAPWQPQAPWHPQPVWQPAPSGAPPTTGSAPAPQAMVPQATVQQAMAPQALAPQGPPPPAHYGWPLHRAQGAPIAPPRPAGGPMRQHHAGWPSAPRQTPQ